MIDCGHGARRPPGETQLGLTLAGVLQQRSVRLDPRWRLPQCPAAIDSLWIRYVDVVQTGWPRILWDVAVAWDVGVGEMERRESVSPSGLTAALELRAVK